MADRTTEEARKAMLIRAAELLRQEATAIKDSHTLEGDWAGECEAKSAHDEMLNVAAALQWQAEQQKGDDGRGLEACVTCGQPAASPHGVPPQPSSIQQRAIYLHEKAAMPWPDAEELALNEAGIDARAIDELIGECGYAGLASMLCTDDELRRFTRSVLVHQPASSLPQAPQGEQWSADELRLFEETLEQFEDCGETDTPYETLMKWAARGWLECQHFVTTAEGKRVLESTPPPLFATPHHGDNDEQA